MESISEFNIFDFHLIVAGSSLAGLACAKEAATLGAKVCVISDGDTFHDLQTTLFLEFLHNSINCGYEAQQMAPFYSWQGIGNNHGNYDYVWKDLMDRIKCAIRSNLQEKIDYFLDKKVSYVEGNFKFLDSHKIAFEETSKRIYWGDKFLIAPSGTKISDRRIPDVKGADLHGITLLDLMNTPELNGEILIVGEGSSALQLAALLAKLFKVTVFSRTHPVPDYDREMINIYVQCTGFKVWTDIRLHFITQTKCGRYEVHYTQISPYWRAISFFDKVIFEPGEDINLKRFELNKAGINATSYKIPTNENFQSNVKHIYAIGRAAKNPQDICHMPYQNGRQLARVMFGKRKCVNTIFDQTGVLLGTPSYSFVGLSEEEAIKRLGSDNIDVYINVFKSHDIILDLPPIFFNYLKVICINDDRKKILGMHYLGPRAATVMQGYAAALRCGKLSLDDLCNHAGIFPTTSREFTEVRMTKRSGVADVAVCCS